LAASDVGHANGLVAGLAARTVTALGDTKAADTAIGVCVPTFEPVKLPTPMVCWVAPVKFDKAVLSAAGCGAAISDGRKLCKNCRPGQGQQRHQNVCWAKFFHGRLQKMGWLAATARKCIPGK